MSLESCLLLPSLSDDFYLFGGWGAHSANDPAFPQSGSQSCDDFCLSLLFTVHIFLSCACSGSCTL